MSAATRYIIQCASAKQGESARPQEATAGLASPVRFHSEESSSLSGAPAGKSLRAALGLEAVGDGFPEILGGCPGLPELFLHVVILEPASQRRG